MFLEVIQCLAGVPREHIYVYTLIGKNCKQEASRLVGEADLAGDEVGIGRGVGAGGFEGNLQSVAG